MSGLMYEIWLKLFFGISVTVMNISEGTFCMRYFSLEDSELFLRENIILRAVTLCRNGDISRMIYSNGVAICMRCEAKLSLIKSPDF